MQPNDLFRDFFLSADLLRKHTRPLILGGSGFIGRNLLQQMVESGMRPVNIDLVGVDLPSVHFCPIDINDTASNSDLDLSNFDIFYLLAWSTSPAIAEKNPILDLQKNALYTLDWVRRMHAVNPSCRIVFVSSGGAIYGEAEQMPISENHALNPKGAYGLGKLVVESYLKAYSNSHALDYLIFRPANPYGLYQNPLSGVGAVTTFLSKAINNQEIEVWGNGNVVRDYLYISDLVDALMCAMSPNPLLYREFNVGSSVGVSLIQLISEIESFLNKPLKLSYQSSRVIDSSQVVLDISRCSSQFAWQPKVSLRQGIQLTYDYLKALKTI